VLWQDVWFCRNSIRYDRHDVDKSELFLIFRIMVWPSNDLRRNNMSCLFLIQPHKNLNQDMDLCIMSKTI
jgi:hypothetical protein